MNVGCRLMTVDDPVQQAAIPVAVLYPTAEPERPARFGPYTLDVAPDAAPAGETRGLVVLSHGAGGSPWSLRGLAAALARAGFVACLPEHLGNSRSDNSLADTRANLENRPRHVSLAIDAVLADPALRRRLAADRVAVVGMSIGGYTALAVAGGRPWSGPYERPEGAPRPLAVTRDPRVCALVLLAPATPWFMAEGALAGVDLPILMRTGERDELTPDWHADLVVGGVANPASIDRQVVENAGHFAFLSPFPAEMTRSDFPPSQDPPGFDRAAYQPRLHAEVLAFLRRWL